MRASVWEEGGSCEESEAEAGERLGPSEANELVVDMSDACRAWETQARGGGCRLSGESPRPPLAPPSPVSPTPALADGNVDPLADGL